jgi:hypothetical protein
MHLISPHNPSNWFTLAHPSKHPFHPSKVGDFDHYNGITFTRILFHDSYYFKNHHPKEFQVHIFPFDWVLGALTFQVTFDFNPIFSYLKPGGLTWDQGVFSFDVSRTYFSNFISIR